MKLGHHQFRKIVPVLANKLNLLVLVDKWSNKVTYGLPQEAMVQLRSWMIPAEACLGTFVALKGACGKTTTTTWGRGV